MDLVVGQARRSVAWLVGFGLGGWLYDSKRVRQKLEQPLFTELRNRETGKEMRKATRRIDVTKVRSQRDQERLAGRAGCSRVVLGHKGRIVPAAALGEGGK